MDGDEIVGARSEYGGMGRAVELGMTHHGVGGNLEPSTMGSATQSTMGISATQCSASWSTTVHLGCNIQSIAKHLER